MTEPAAWAAWHHFKTLPSTNDFAKALASSKSWQASAQTTRRGSTSTAVLVSAEEQSAGRGQFDRSWVSPKGGLYFSLLYQPRVPARFWPELSLLTVAALKETLESLVPEEERAAFPLWVKPPNDLYLASRKLAGVLLETASPGSWVVVGVGVNLYSSPILPDTSAILADALVQRDGLPTTRELVCRCAQRCLQAYSIWEDVHD